MLYLCKWTLMKTEISSKALYFWDFQWNSVIINVQFLWQLQFSTLCPNYSSNVISLVWRTNTCQKHFWLYLVAIICKYDLVNLVFERHSYNSESCLLSICLLFISYRLTVRSIHPIYRQVHEIFTTYIKCIFRRVYVAWLYERRKSIVRPLG